MCRYGDKFIENVKKGDKYKNWALKIYDATHFQY